MTYISAPAHVGSQLTFVIYNTDHEASSDDDEPPPLSDSSVVEVARCVAEGLSACGRNVELLPLSDSAWHLAEVASKDRRAVFFNLVESLGRDAGREREVPDLLRKLRVCYTGNSARPLEIALDKGRVRKLLRQRGIAVARGGVVHSVRAAHLLVARERLEYPLFVKPARLDASLGVTQSSFVRDRSELSRQVEEVSRLGDGRAVVEEYLPGPEINVSVWPDPSSGLCAASCIDFSSFPRHLVPIVTYACKWEEGHEEYSAWSVPASQLVESSIIELAIETARRAVAAIGAHAYARVDLRLDANGTPCVMDINPNPDLHPQAGFALSLRAQGIDYPSMLEGVVDAALERHNHEISRVLRRRPRSSRARVAVNT